MAPSIQALIPGSGEQGFNVPKLPYPGSGNVVREVEWEMEEYSEDGWMSGRVVAVGGTGDSCTRVEEADGSRRLI